MLLQKGFGPIVGTMVPWWHQESIMMSNGLGIDWLTYYQGSLMLRAVGTGE